MALNPEASAALVFLILYAILFIYLILGYASGRLRIHSRFSLITFHVTVRLASQAAGLAFGVVVYANTSLLVAYFVLGAEGYFILILCAYHFLISWQNHNTTSHQSWLDPHYTPSGSCYTRLRDLFGKKRRPMVIIHYLLIVADGILMSGGTTLSGGAHNANDFVEGSLIAGVANNAKDLQSKITTAKAMLVTGQAIFLLVTTFLLYCIISVIQQSHREKPNRPTHPTLLILLSVWPLLFIRGLYGVLSAVLPAISYFNHNSYDESGLTNLFVISENILGTAMEWSSCALLMVTYITSRKDANKTDVIKEHELVEEAM